jgi:Fic family protein
MGRQLEFFYTGVVQTATLAVSTARRLQALFQEDAARLNAKGRGGATLVRTFDLLRATPLVSIQNLTPRLGVSFPTAARAVETLMRLGILREITGRLRDRVFVYDRYLSILAEGTEPP